MLAGGQLARYYVGEQERAPVELLEKCVLLQTHEDPILIRILPSPISWRHSQGIASCNTAASDSATNPTPLDPPASMQPEIRDGSGNRRELRQYSSAEGSFSGWQETI